MRVFLKEGPRGGDHNARITFQYLLPEFLVADLHHVLIPVDRQVRWRRVVFSGELDDDGVYGGDIGDLVADVFQHPLPFAVFGFDVSAVEPEL